MHLTEVMPMLDERGITLVMLDQPADTSTPADRMSFRMLAAISEFERGQLGCSRARPSSGSLQDHRGGPSLPHGLP